MCSTQNNTFKGTFTVNGGSVWGGTEGLTLQNINFIGVLSNDDYVTIGENVPGNTSRYAHNVIIKDCKFGPIMTGPGIVNIVAVRAYQANDIMIMNCEAEDLHSFAQITGGNNVKIDGLVSNCVRGLSLGSATNCFVANANITATGADKYGIRHNADSGVDVLTLTNVNVNAFIPVVTRHTNDTPVTSYKVVFEGVNTLTKAGDWHVAIAEEEYDTVGETLTHLPNVAVEGTGVDGTWVIF